MVPPPKKISAKPEAELAPRRDDQLLSSDELKQFELFGELKKSITVEKFPGSIVLRRFRKGDTICRQGDRGHSAFYIASAADMRRLETLRGGNEDASEATAANTEKRRVATAYLLSGTAVATPGSFANRFWKRRQVPEAPQPASIPNDGPTDIDYATRQAPMLEGDVFGEMSCMTLAPRSATIVVDEDCYMIEFMRNIFDKVQGDAGYRKRADEVYAQRVLDTHLGRLEIFQGLTEPQLRVLRAAAHLEVVEPGAVICDEGDLSDSIYLIRSGVVQVVRGAHVALRAADVADWPSFCQALIGQDGDGPEKDGAPSIAGGADTPAAKKPAAAAAAKSKPAANVADILAAARGGKKKPSPAKPRTSGGPSAADILAAARGGKRPGGESGPTKPAAKPTAAEPTAAEPPSGKGSVDKPAVDKPAVGKPAVGKPAVSKPAVSKPAVSKPAASRAADSDTLLAAKPPSVTGKPDRCVWQWFGPRVQSAIRSLAAGQGSSDDQGLVIQAVNQLICRRDFVAAQDVAPVLEKKEVANVWSSFPQGLAGARKQWSELEVRVAGLAALRAIFPAALGPRPLQKGPPDILSYLSRGDCFGEMAVVLDTPRQATCVAYDHPADDSRRKPGRVELVRIDGAAFKSLLEESTVLRARVDQLVKKRYGDIVAGELRPVGAGEPLSHSEAYRDEGLAQGQSLLLIDLDRCTRCGDCVRACQQTHDDGYSRLFLDGPTFDRFLIPSACRQCLNPACMIGCPVGSIQRGDNGQIEIRDWCIGCKLCADQCPYDSIQMHDIGIIPEQTVGWQFAPASLTAGKDWQARHYRARNWSVGIAPFRWTLDLVEQLASCARDGAWQAESASLSGPICFRYPFEVSRDQFKQGAFHLHIASSGLTVHVWLNGQPILAEPPANPKKKPKADEVQARLTQSDLRLGSNLLAVQVDPPAAADGGGHYVPKYNQPIVTARLDALPQAGELATATAGDRFELEVELVKRRAVVCDLCSSLANQQPACVDQCPHEAAIRINAQSEFPST